MNFIFNRLLFFFVEIFSIKFFGRKFFDKFFFGNFSQQTLASRNFQPAKFSAIKNFSPKNFRKNFLALAIRVDRFCVGRSDISRSQRRRRTCQAQHSPRVYARALRALRIRARKEFFRSKPRHEGTPSPPLFDPFY